MKVIVNVHSNANHALHWRKGKEKTKKDRRQEKEVKNKQTNS